MTKPKAQTQILTRYLLSRYSNGAALQITKTNDGKPIEITLTKNGITIYPNDQELRQLCYAVDEAFPLVDENVQHASGEVQ